MRKGRRKTKEGKEEKKENKKKKENLHQISTFHNIHSLLPSAGLCALLFGCSFCFHALWNS